MNNLAYFNNVSNENNNSMLDDELRSDLQSKMDIIVWDSIHLANIIARLTVIMCIFIKITIGMSLMSCLLL